MSRRASGRTASSRWATVSAMPTAGIIRTSTSASRSISRRRARTAIACRRRSSVMRGCLLTGRVPARERLMALAFLTHFVGDLHQPMHAGDHGDLGGNRVAANYGVIGGRANFHGIWDGWLAERAISTPPAGAGGDPGATSVGRAASGLPAGPSRTGAARCGRSRAARPIAACSAIPAATPPAERPVLDEAEVRALIPLVRENVRTAASGSPGCSTMRWGPKPRRRDSGGRSIAAERRTCRRPFCTAGLEGGTGEENVDRSRGSGDRAARRRLRPSWVEQL